MELFYNAAANCLTDADGKRLKAIPQVTYGVNPTINLTVTSNGVTPMDLSGAAQWHGVVDSERDAGTVPMSIISPASVTVSGSTVGFEINTETPAFYDQLNSKEKLSLICELYGENAAGERIFRFPFRLKGVMPVEPGEINAPILPPTTGSYLLINKGTASHVSQCPEYDKIDIYGSLYVDPLLEYGFISNVVMYHGGSLSVDVMKELYVDGIFIQNENQEEAIDIYIATSGARGNEKIYFYIDFTDVLGDHVNFEVNASNEFILVGNAKTINNNCHMYAGATKIDCDLTVTGGVVQFESFFWLSGYTLTINGGFVTLGYANGSYEDGEMRMHSNSKIIVNGGTVWLPPTLKYNTNTTGATVHINGGTVYPIPYWWGMDPNGFVIPQLHNGTITHPNGISNGYMLVLDIHGGTLLLDEVVFLTISGGSAKLNKCTILNASGGVIDVMATNPDCSIEGTGGTVSVHAKTFYSTDNIGGSCIVKRIGYGENSSATITSGGKLLGLNGNLCTVEEGASVHVQSGGYAEVSMISGTLTVDAGGSVKYSVAAVNPGDVEINIAPGATVIQL